MRRYSISLAGLFFASTSLVGCSFVRHFDDFQAACVDGTTDCDPLVAGCETDTDNGRSNCGACGVSCGLTDFCGEGSCQRYQANFGIGGSTAAGVSPPSIAAGINGGVFVGYYHSKDLTFGGLTIPAANSEVSILRVNRAGDVNFAVSLTGSGYESLGDLVQTSYGVVASTYFASPTVYIGSSSGSPTTVTNSATDGTSDGLLWGLNEDGTYRWHVRAGGAGYTAFTDVTTDGAGNVYAAGYFSNSELTIGQSTTNQAMGLTGGIFVVKLLANGAIGWVTPLDAPTALLGSLEADSQGNLYLFSTSSGTVTIGGVTSVGNSTPRIVAFNGSDGSVRWFQSYPGAEPSWDAGDSLDVIRGATSADDRLFVAFYSSNPSSALGTIPISQGAVVAEIDRATGNPISAHVVTNDARPFGLSHDGAGNLIMSGYVFDTTLTQLDLLGVTVPYTTVGSWDALIMGMTPSGTYRFSKTFGTTQYEYSYDLAVNASGTVFVSTFTTAQLDVDAVSLAPVGAYQNGVVVRFDPVDVLPLP